MKTYNFEFTLEEVDVWSDDVLNALFEAGCNDASFGSRSGVAYAEFDRESPSRQEAIESAAHAIKQAVPGARLTLVNSESPQG